MIPLTSQPEDKHGRLTMSATIMRQTSERAVRSECLMHAANQLALTDDPGNIHSLCTEM